MDMQLQKQKEDGQLENLPETRTLHFDTAQNNTILSPAHQILTGTRTHSAYGLPSGNSESLLSGNPYLLGSDVGTLSRSMTALNLTDTIPEEPAEVNFGPSLMDARRIAKSAIDLVGLNANDGYDANASFPGDFGSSMLGMHDRLSSMENGISFNVTSLPSRTLIVRNFSPLINDNAVRTLFQFYGEVKSIRTEFRMQGILQVTYFDIRAAASAKMQLDGYALAEQCLSVQYVTTPGSIGGFTEGTLVMGNIDPSIDNQQVASRLSIYGDVKRVQEIPDKDGHRLVEFYDLRHARRAMEVMNDADSFKTGMPTGMKQTMSLQQLAGAGIDNEEDDDQASKSWDGSAQAMQQMDALLRLSEPVASQLSTNHTSDLRKTMSFGSGLGELRGLSNVAQETPRSTMNRVVELTPELAERLRISDSASSLGTPLFPGQGSGSTHTTSSLGFGNLGTYGNASAMDDFGRGMSNSTSVGTGLDSYAQNSLSTQGLDTSMIGQPPSLQVPGMMNFGSAGLNPLQGYLNSPNSISMMAQSGGGNLLQTLVAAQAAGLNVYDILSRLPGANPGNLSQLLAANRSPISPGAGSSGMFGNLASQNSMSGMHNLQSTSSFGSTGLTNTGFGLGTPGSGLDLGSMSKSASSPALHVSTEERESAHRFGGRLSRRNVDPMIEAERRAQQQRLYSLDLDKIRRGEDRRTTLMIKNIPNKYTQKMLLASIDETLKGKYDFFYLPIDFKNKCNVGYGFINMREPEDIIPLVERFHNKKWERFNSEKICCVAYGRIQGKQALINHFQNSSLMHEDKKHRPVLFVTEGPSKGEPEPFPIGSNIRPKITLKERDFRSRERSGHWA